MVSTRSVVPLLRPEAKVHHLATDDSSDVIAWVEGSRTVRLGRLVDAGTLEVLESFNTEHRVSYLGFHRDGLLVGDDLDSLMFYDLDGTLIESQAIDGGVQSCHFMGLKLVILSGMGEVVLSQRERDSVNLSKKFGLDDVVHVEVHGERLFIAEQRGTVLACTEDAVVWRRPPRGEHGERITALGLTKQGRLFLTREGHALVAGEEEAIEFEVWEDGRLLTRNDLRKRLLTSSVASWGAVLGFDDGTVHRLYEDGQMEGVLDTGYSVFSCLEHRSGIIASSWFYIHGEEDEQPWKVEHQGMPRLMVVNERHQGLLFAGDDQNDYTAPEPIGWIDLAAPVQEMDAAELTLWFQEAPASDGLTAEELYGGEDDVLHLLTEEERQQFQAVSQGTSHASLLAAMDEDVSPTSVEVEPTSENDLLEALQGMEELALDATEDLMDALAASVDEFIPPRAIAGDDQRHTAGDDGTCVVVLDGRGSFDPQEQIASWSWHDQRGRELAVAPQLKLKLPVGQHRFELRVVDQQGAWTTDSVVIHIADGSTS